MYHKRRGGRTLDERMDIGIAVRRLSLQMRRHHDAAVDRLSGGRLTGARGWIIGYLASHDGKPVYQRDIETRFGIRRSTATVMLQLMEKNGLILRESVESDARLKSLVPTEKAAQLDEQIRESLHQSEKRLTQGLSDEQLELFLKTAAHMSANLDGKERRFFSSNLNGRIPRQKWR